MTFPWRVLPMVVLAWTLAACQPTSAPVKTLPHPQGVASSLKPNMLMDAVFGHDDQVAPNGVQWRAVLALPPAVAARLPEHTVGLSAAQRAAASQAASAIVPPQTLPAPEPTEVWVKPRQVVRINDERAALVFESAPFNKAGKEWTPDTQAWLGVVFFQKIANGKDKEQGASAKDVPEQWQVEQFVPYVDALGYNGTAGESEVYKLSQDHYLLAFNTAQCASGLCVGWLNAYQLHAGDMQPVLRVQLSGSNFGAYTDCAARLLGHRKAPAASAASGGSHHTCYAIDGETHLLSREVGDADLVVQYNGWRSTPGHTRQLIQLSERYRMVDGRYQRLGQGKSAIPWE